MSNLPLLKIAAQINREYEAANRVYKDSLRHAKNAGALLNEAFEQLGYGQKSPWLRENCPNISERTAQLYIRIAQKWPAIESRVVSGDILTVQGAMKALAAPKSATVAALPNGHAPAESGEHADPARSDDYAVRDGDGEFAYGMIDHNGVIRVYGIDDDSLMMTLEPSAVVRQNLGAGWQRLQATVE
jgi:hypothetical protein